MINALKEMLASKKFVASLIGMLAFGLGHWGIKIDQEKMVELLAPLMAYILGQGIADQGKLLAQHGAAKGADPKSSSSSSASPLFALIVAGSCLAAAHATVTMATGCNTIPPNIPGVLVDCTAQDQGKIASLVAELAPLLSGGSVDWSAVKQRAEQAGTAIGGCVLSELVQQYLGGNKAPAHDQGIAAHDALRDFKKAHGVETFHTAHGNL